MRLTCRLGVCSCCDCYVLAFRWLEISNFTKDFQRTFFASCQAYDQSLAGDDTLLAGALYRNLFAEGVDAVTLARTVGYVRKQLAADEDFGDGNQ